MPILPDWERSADGKLAIEELMPTSSPLALTSAPPELPGLIAALVWMALVTTTPDEESYDPNTSSESSRLMVVTGRLRALMMPVVTDPDSPSGLPTAMTGAPTVSLLELANLIGFMDSGGFVTRMTARSVDGSLPTTLASYVLLPIDTVS